MATFADLYPNTGNTTTRCAKTCSPIKATALLYHGTSAQHLETIRANGLQPFGRGVPAHELRPDRADCINEYTFLTSFYGLSFAAYGCRFQREKGVVVEVATASLDATRFYPDEIQLLHAGETWTAYGRVLLTPAERAAGATPRAYPSEAAFSLQQYSTVAYDGGIAVEALTRYAVVDFAVCEWWYQLARALIRRGEGPRPPGVLSLMPLLFEGIPSPHFTREENAVLLRERRQGIRVGHFGR